MAKNNTFTSYVENFDFNPAVRLGPYASSEWQADPKHLFFSLARYKFCAKMLNGYKTILEVGCGDGFAHPMLLQFVKHIHGIDVNSLIIEYNQRHNLYPDKLSYETKNISQAPYQEKFDAAISLDVIEHIEPEKEYIFLQNIAKSLNAHAPLLIGTPNITASVYASDGSKEEHINLKSHETLLDSLKQHFYNVFLFSMNDEVVHTGFHAMAHYIFALAVSPKIE